jgi:hypothetical protein
MTCPQPVRYILWVRDAPDTLDRPYPDAEHQRELVDLRLARFAAQRLTARSSVFYVAITLSTGALVAAYRDGAELDAGEALAAVQTPADHKARALAARAVTLRTAWLETRRDALEAARQAGWTQDEIAAALGMSAYGPLRAYKRNADAGRVA